MLTANEEADLLDKAGLPRDEHDTFVLPRTHLLHHDRHTVTVAVPYRDVEAAGYTTDERAQNNEIVARREAHEEERDNMADELASALDDLLALAEADRLEDSRDVDSTDVIFHGEAVALARAVRRIVADITKTTVH